MEGRAAVPLFGNLATLPLADLLQCVGNLRRSGCLEISHNRVETRTYFRENRIIACSADDPPKLLGHFLLFHGAITQDVLRRALALQESTGETLGAILRRMGAVSPHQLSSLVETKAEETLLGLFELKDGVFAFRENRSLDPNAMGVSITPCDLILQGAKRLDDLARARAVFEGPQVVPERTVPQASGDLLGHWPTRHIYDAIDGERTVEQIAFQVHGTESVVLLYLYGIWERGWVRVKQKQLARLEVGTEGRSGAEVAATPALAQPPMARDLEEARRHIASCNFAGALEILGAAHDADPTDSSIQRLIEEAEQGLIDQISREGLSPTRVPVVVQSREALANERLTAGEDFLLNLIDGSWDIKSLIWVTPMRQLETLSCLKRLAERGFIEFREQGHGSSRDGMPASSSEPASPVSER